MWSARKICHIITQHTHQYARVVTFSLSSFKCNGSRKQPPQIDLALYCHLIHSGPAARHVQQARATSEDAGGLEGVRVILACRGH